MGAETSALLKELAEEIATQEGRGTSQNELTRNGWDPKDKSENITLDDSKTKAVRNDSEGSVDAIRGVMTYRKGVHLIDFEWTPGDSKYVAIGVATTSAPLKASGDIQLLGYDDQSVGWNLVTRKVYFNGCETGNFPEEVSSSYRVPKKVTMVLDMNEGTLSFKVDSGSIEVAMRGLKHIGEKLYLVAAMNKPWETVKVKYLGNLDTLKRQVEYQKSGDLHFHDTHGKCAFLGNDNKTAARENPLENTCDATVLTNRILKEGELFSLRIDKEVEVKKYAGSWTVGLTTASPSEMNFMRDMSKNSQGKTWLVSGKKVYYQRSKIEEMNTDIDDLGVGDVIGLKKESKKIKVYINGSQHVTVSMSEDANVYGFVDVFGKARQISIVGTGQEGLHRSMKGSMKMPKTEGEYRDGVIRVMDMLKSRVKDEIPGVYKAIKVYLYIPFENMKEDKYKTRSAEFLANIRDAGRTITEYMKFVWDSFGSDVEIHNCYLILLETAVYYSGKSFDLSKQFGASGLVSICLRALIGMDSNNLKESKIRIKFISKWFRLLQNCARVSDNHNFYEKDSIYLAICKEYLKSNIDEYRVVVPIIVTLCFLVDDDKPPVMSDTSNKHILAVFKKSIQQKHSDGSHHFEGWYAHEMAMCVGMLAQNKSNLDRICSDGEVYSLLVQMLGFEEDKDKECAANALWSLTSEFNYKTLYKLPGLLENLKQLIQSGSESVMQAARRLTLKLNRMADGTQKSTTRSCDYLAKCAKFLESISIDGTYLDEKYNKCYCVECHSLRSDKAHYNRGEPPKTHAIPVGWVRFGLSAPARAKSLQVYTKWHTAYHGTKKEHLSPILDVGNLVPAGRNIMGGIDVKEGSKHFSEDWKPDGFNTKQVFLSPSIRYAGVNTYARPSSFVMKDSKGKELSFLAKVAFQVFVKPGSYEVGNETIGASQVIDPGFSNQELEWSTTQDGATILNGILVKLEKN